MAAFALLYASWPDYLDIQRPRNAWLQKHNQAWRVIDKRRSCGRPEWAVQIRLQTYRGPEDLDVQNAFWTRITRDLPWCWKPTTSPALYAKGAQFDPRSRCFAYDGDRLVGYMSFTGADDFVSLGYPWVLSGYEGDLQEKLYDAVYGFAAGPEYGGKTFAQRFRHQWAAQISFFERHGFAEVRNDPIYALDLRTAAIGGPPHAAIFGNAAPERPPAGGRYRLEVHQGFEWDEFHKLAAGTISEPQLAMFKSYFQTVDFDFAVKATEQNRLAAYRGFALRADTRFAELIAVSLDPATADVLRPCLSASVRELQARDAAFLGTKPIPAKDASEILACMGFAKVSAELLLSKSV